MMGPEHDDDAELKEFANKFCDCTSDFMSKKYIVR